MRENFRPSVAERTNRRRLRVFLGTLSVALALSLAFTWLRPAEYRSAAMLEILPGAETAGARSGAPRITPGSESPSSRSGARSAPESAKPFLTEVQILTSRPVLETVVTRLRRDGRDVSAFGVDAAAGMQSRLEAIPITSTNVVELVATGERPELLAPLLNTIIAVYQERLADSYRTSIGESMAQADDEVKRLEATVAAKRRGVESFRTSNEIISTQRDENEVLARVRNLSTSLSAANDKVAAAEGKLRAIKESAAAGKTVVRAKDDPTLANLEQRASQIREDLRDLERGFTQDYLAKDPKVVNKRERLAELERQIVAQRTTGQQTALLEAQEELTSAQGAVARIQSQMSSTRQEAGQFATRFNEYKSRQEELSELEAAYRDAVQRRATLDASERARTPTTKVLEAATTPQQPSRPLYWRDTGISIGGSLLFALLAMWLVELFNRSEPHPSVVLIQPQVGRLPYEAGSHMLPGQNAPMLTVEARNPALLTQQPAFPRELNHAEMAALVNASDDDCRLVISLLMNGTNADEALKVQWADVDLSQGVIRVPGASKRNIALNAATAHLIAARSKGADSSFLVGMTDQPVTRDSIDAQILCAAHDAGLDGATQVNSDCLRHTYVAFLVRQGMRFGDLVQLVGPMPADMLGMYSALSPTGSRLPREGLSLEHPAVGHAIA